MEGHRGNNVDWTEWCRLALREASRLCSDPLIVEEAVERACHEVLCTHLTGALLRGVEALLVVRVRSRVVDLLRERGRAPKRMDVELDAVCISAHVDEAATIGQVTNWVASIQSVLTDRQRLVYEGLASGRPKKAIARDLEISPKAIREAIAGIRRKIRANPPPRCGGEVNDRVAFRPSPPNPEQLLLAYFFL